jgi:hypothetical protein
LISILSREFFCEQGEWRRDIPRQLGMVRGF